MVGARWGMRSLGIVSTIVLARILAPRDFGLVAVATLVTGMISIFAEVGLLLYLIRERDIERSHLDTVWSLRLVIGVVLGALIFLCAPFAAQWFQEPAAAAVIRTLSIPTFLQGLQNPGIALLRKNLDFRRDFQFMVVPKVASFIVTVGLAIAVRNYWALVAGIIAGSSVALLQSYVLHPFRPRFDLSRTSSVWNFSTWTLVWQVLDFMTSQLETLLIGRLRNSSDVGLYSIANDVATAPTNELVMPLTRVLFPAYSKVAHDREQLAALAGKIFAAFATLVLPVGIGISLVASDAVHVFLGAKWIDTVPLVQVLAIAGAFLALTQAVHPVLGALGKPKISAHLTLTQLLMRAALMLPALLLYGLVELALARLLVSMLIWVIAIVVFVRVAEIPARTALQGLGRTLIALAVMSATALIVQQACPELPALRLATAASTGCIAYILTLLVAWKLCGSPPTIEADIIVLAKRLRAIRRR